MSFLVNYINQQQAAYAGGTTQPPNKIVGCMDKTATNYNPNATVHDQLLCTYNPAGGYTRDPAQLWASSTFDGGTLNGNFKQEVYEPYGFGVSNVRSRFAGGMSGRFEMRADSTITVDNKARSEIKINDQNLLKVKRKFGYSIYMGATDFKEDLDNSDYYCYCMQEHGWDTRTPPRGVFIKGPKMYYKINYGKTTSATPDGSEIFDLGSPPKDRWVDFYFDVNISYNADGWVNAFMSKPDPVTGVVKLYQFLKYTGPTGYNNAFMADYPKFGMYKRHFGSNVDGLIIFYDEIRWGKETANIRDVIPDKDMVIVYLD